MKHLRKLTIGPIISAKIVNKNAEQVVIKARENNAVAITLTDYQIQIKSKNQYSRLITLFVCKVPEFSERNIENSIESILSLKGNSQTFSLPNPMPELSLKHLLLGTEAQMKIVLQGYDEAGRQISVPVQDF